MQHVLTLLAQDSGGAAGGLVGMLFGLVIAVVMIAAMWKLFEKAGEPGWAAIVPIYNIVVMLKLAGKPIWWIVLFFIPLVSIIAVFLIYISLAKNFGKSAGFGIGMVILPFIFFPMLGFSDARYQPVSQ